MVAKEWLEFEQGQGALNKTSQTGWKLVQASLSVYGVGIRRLVDDGLKRASTSYRILVVFDDDNILCLQP